MYWSAADKGLVLVCSAGNSGRGTWKKITPPGDAENVITVGAADRNLVNADFSSVGNTTDGRVKPDVMAVGVASAVAGNDGTVSRRLVPGLLPSRWWRQCGMQETVKSIRIIFTVMVCLISGKLVK